MRTSSRRKLKNLSKTLMEVISLKKIIRKFVISAMAILFTNVSMVEASELVD